jgi:hypothetical protein
MPTAGTVLCLFRVQKEEIPYANRCNLLFKTCESCRDKRIDRVRIERDAAHALGLRWRLTFVALSRVTSLNGLLFVEKLDWERVKKLGGKFLPMRLQYKT